MPVNGIQTINIVRLIIEKKHVSAEAPYMLV